MSYNVFGTHVRVVTFGESHGPLVGAVVDGLPPGFAIDLPRLQAELARRRPGRSRFVSPRHERDQAEIVSGLFEGQTTGAPLTILIRNEDAEPAEYDDLETLFRPGHADFGVWKRYGIRDHRGGGRLSGRETAARVAAGAIARQVLEKENGIAITGFVRQIGRVTAPAVDLNFVPRSEIYAPDPASEPAMLAEIESAMNDGDSVGGVVEVWARHVPAGWGDPVFLKLDAQLAAACMSIGGVKGVEIGDGFALAASRGSQANDPFLPGHRFASNHAGGVLGGMTTGQDIIVRLAVKPTSSIARPQALATVAGEVVTHARQGRHDPCLCPRIVVVAETMVALTLLDAWRRRQTDR
jgi:chorismate synthase